MLRKVQDLGEPQRSVVFLHYWLDRTTAEIGDLLDLPSGTVKSHLHRARQKLARALGEEDRHE
jgi:RNA polymerase sigma-70 factor (ECF subfamily)